MSRARRHAAVALCLAVAAYVAAARLVPAFATAGQCSPALQASQRGVAVPAGAREAACYQSGDGSMSGAAASVGAACVALVAAAARLGSRAAASKRKSRAVVLQATFDAPETSPTDVPRAQFSFAGVTAPAPISPAVRQSSVAMHLLMPKNIKWRKPHKPSMKPFHHSTKWKFRGWATTGIKPHFGKYALQILEEMWLSNKAIEEHRRRMTRTMERKGKVFIRVFPHHAITQRVAESRMGAGKGAIKYWCAAVRPYFILYEIDGVSEEIATEAFRKVSYLVGCRTRMLKKEDGPSMFELGLSGKPKQRRDPRDFGKKE